MKIIPKAQEKYPVSINLPRSLTRFYIVILQHEVLPRLAFFQLSGSGQNKYYVRISTKLAKACQYLLL